jgi:FtsZ-binding cell division protein ZapB
MPSSRSSAELSAGIAAFDEKLALVLSNQAKLRWELEDIKKKNKILREEKDHFEAEYQELKKKHRQLQKDFNRSKFFAKLVTNKLTPTGGISELKKDIDHYIKSIDAIIANLRETL